MSFVLPSLEVCLDSADSAVAAEQGGASRVELCDNLIEGGTTPSFGMIEATRAAVTIPLHVMIRPRGGDFCYSECEASAMLTDIDVARRLGAEGVVFGALTTEGQIDRQLTARLLARADGLAVTFHRAFDMTRDPFAALEELIALGVDRLLTSGQEPSVLEGLELITELIERARGRMIIMPGCGITPRNIVKIARRSGAEELHVAATEAALSPMRHRNPHVFMGTELRSPEYQRLVTSATGVRQLLATLSVGGPSNS